MERLTMKWKNGVYDTFNPIDIEDNEYSKINYEKLLTKLGEYEDLEEQGLLFRLPCKVGDILWNYEGRMTEPIPFTVKEFKIMSYRIDRIEIYFEDGSGFTVCLFDGTLDEGWFRSEEAALEKMKGGNK